MACSLTLLPGSAIRWRQRRYVIVDYVGLDVIIAREPGQRKLERIPVHEVESAHTASTGWIPPDLVSVPEEQWPSETAWYQYSGDDGRWYSPS